MYRPPALRVDDEGAAFRLIAEHGFATLATVHQGVVAISQLPMIGDAERRTLRGHLARANPHAALIGGARATVVFTGPQGYVSPNWYEDRTRVPTWNYATVEIAGAVRLLESVEAVDSLLIDLSHHFESRRHDLHRDVEWTIDKLPAEKHARLRGGIAAFEVVIDRIEMKAKLSQNVGAADRNGAIKALSAGDEAQRSLADAMREAAP